MHFLSRFLIAILTLAILYFLPYRQFSDFHLIVLIFLVAIPIAAYRLEYRLFARRAVITLGSTPDGLGKKLFWNAAIVKITNYCIAILIATLLVLFVSSFNKLDLDSSQTLSEVSASIYSSEWTVVFAATVLLLLLDRLVSRPIQRHTRGQMSAIATRGLIKWPVLAFIIAIVYLNFFYTAHESYVGADLNTLIENKFQEQLELYSSPLLGLIHAFRSALDSATMFFAQNYIPRIDDAATKWFVWSYLAIKSAIAVGVVCYLMLGILTLASVRERGGWKLLGRSVFEKYFTITLIVFISIYLYASSIQYLPEQPVVVVPEVDCDELRAVLEKEKSERVQNLSVDEKALSAEVTQRIETDIDKIFESADSGIEEFLDWHFSVVGEYQQLGAQISPKIASGAASKLNTHVMNQINNGLSGLEKIVDAEILAGLNNSSSGRTIDFAELPNFGECFPSLDLTALSFPEHPVYVGQTQSVVAGGAIAAIVVKKTTAKLAAKTAGKAAAKYGASLGTGLTAAGLCGPFAPVCGISAATITWFAMDAAIVTADEFMNRDELRQDIKDGLAEQKSTIRDKMISMKVEKITRGYGQLKTQFRIPEDGV
jgi:hypothetical protein